MDDIGHSFAHETSSCRVSACIISAYCVKNPTNTADVLPLKKLIWRNITAEFFFEVLTITKSPDTCYVEHAAIQLTFNRWLY